MRLDLVLMLKNLYMCVSLDWILWCILDATLLQPASLALYSFTFMQAHFLLMKSNKKRLNLRILNVIYFKLYAVDIHQI